MTKPPRRIWSDAVTLEAVREFIPRTIVEHLGIEITGLGDDSLTGTMPVTERTAQPMGILHGGASLVLAETLVSFAANSLVDRSRHSVVGQEINANHLRPAPLGTRVTGVARPFHIGQRSQVWGVEIRNDAGQLTCVSRITMAVVERIVPR
jgi:1,4-dihydroxy-2-naphthoyl-CoA hydrolase